MKFNKLVRDNIPEIIDANGEIAVTHMADDQEYRRRLLEKLREEVEEFIEEPSIGEMADMQEVLLALQDYFQFSSDDVEKKRQEKKEKRGGFEKRIVLEETR